MIELAGPPWRHEGACRGQPANLFYPGRGETPHTAFALCATCPVLLDCREWGIRHERQGVWGGTSEGERWRIRRRLGIRVLAPEEAFDDEWKHERCVALFRQGWNVQEIAAELSVNQRTIHRWLNEGSDIAYPPPTDEPHAGGMKSTA